MKVVTRKKFLLFAGLEFAAILITILAFAIIKLRPLASVVAATPFILVGLYIIRELWRTHRPLQFATFYMAILHVALTTIIGAQRVLFWDLPLEQILLFDIPLPVFHKVAQTCFWILIAATYVDMYRELKKAELRPNPA